MHIPNKGLILYRAERHQKNFPVNKKYGYYSNKLFSPFVRAYNEPFDNSHQRYKKKFVQEIHMTIYSRSLETKKARRLLSKYHHVKKCIIQPFSSIYEGFPPDKFTRKEFQRTFKILKRIKELKWYFLGEFKGQVCKSLLLLSSLESLSLPLFSYDDRLSNMNLFDGTVKLASKRRSWKNFKALNIQLCPPKVLYTNHYNIFPIHKSLSKLLLFLKGLKDYCQEIYKCSSFQLELPTSAKMSADKLEILLEIAKIAPSITRIHGLETDKFSGLSKMVEHSLGLKQVSLIVSHEFQNKLDLSVLHKMQNLEEFTLDVSKNERMDLFLCKPFLIQVQPLRNLTTLSLKFHERILRTFMNNKFDMPRMISDFTNLKSLELFFGNDGTFERPKPSNGIWLVDTLKAIGEKLQLEKLLLSFSMANFEDPRSIFKNFYQSVKKLTGLSVLKLVILAADTINDEDLMALCQSLSRLKSIRDLVLRIPKQYYIKIKTLLAFFDCFVNNLPFLSKLDFKLSCVRTTHESYRLLSEAISRMRCLNSIYLVLIGEIETGLDLKNLEAEVRKKISGNIFYSKTYSYYERLY